MSRWGLAGAWIVVAALATLVTWQIVSAADAQVNDRPVEALDIGVVAPPGSSTSTTVAFTGSSGGSESSTTTVPTESTSSPDTTIPTSAGTTATASETSQIRTISTGGGTVVVSYLPGEVVLQTAAPAPGFSADIKKEGPPDVDVEFESESSKFRVEAEWDDGELVVEIDSDD